MQADAVARSYAELAKASVRNGCTPGNALTVDTSTFPTGYTASAPSSGAGAAICPGTSVPQQIDVTVATPSSATAHLQLRGPGAMIARLTRTRGEEGATLILVIGFMVMVGLVSAGLSAQLASSSKTRVALDQARNRQYTADAAILAYIPQVRSNMESNQALTPCSGTHNHITQSPGLNNVPIQVDCDYSGPSLTFSGFPQRVVRFTACPPQSGGAACPSSAAIIQAQVNYASLPTDAYNASDITVTKTFIQTWNVKT